MRNTTQTIKSFPDREAFLTIHRMNGKLAAHKALAAFQ